MNSLARRVVAFLEAMDPESVTYKTIYANIRAYPLGLPSLGEAPLLVEVQNALARGANAVTIGLLDLQHVSERYTQERYFTMKESDYQDAVYKGLRDWWKKEVLQDAAKLFDKYVTRDMLVITGM